MTGVAAAGSRRSLPVVPAQPRMHFRALRACEEHVNVTGLRFAANLSIIYGHLPLLERPTAAAVHQPGPAR
jgi:hypothetical protein